MYICIYIYVIMKKMCPPGYHLNGFVATHALGHMIYVYKYIYISILAHQSQSSEQGSISISQTWNSMVRAEEDSFRKSWLKVF